MRFSTNPANPAESRRNPAGGIRTGGGDGGKFNPANPAVPLDGGGIKTAGLGGGRRNPDSPTIGANPAGSAPA
jgi:hypothetical protein